MTSAPTLRAKPIHRSAFDIPIPMPQRPSAVSAAMQPASAQWRSPADGAPIAARNEFCQPAAANIATAVPAVDNPNAVMRQ